MAAPEQWGDFEGLPAQGWGGPEWQHELGVVQTAQEAGVVQAAQGAGATMAASIDWDAGSAELGDVLRRIAEMSQAEGQNGSQSAFNQEEYDALFDRIISFTPPLINDEVNNGHASQSYGSVIIQLLQAA